MQPVPGHRAPAVPRPAAGAARRRPAHPRGRAHLRDRRRRAARPRVRAADRQGQRDRQDPPAPGGGGQRPIAGGAALGRAVLPRRGRLRGAGGGGRRAVRAARRGLPAGRGADRRRRAAGDPAGEPARAGAAQPPAVARRPGPARLPGPADRSRQRADRRHRSGVAGDGVQPRAAQPHRLPPRRGGGARPARLPAAIRSLAGDVDPGRGAGRPELRRDRGADRLAPQRPGADDVEHRRDRRPRRWWRSARTRPGSPSCRPR